MIKSHKEHKENVALAPKPVHPTAVRFHGLLGTPYLRHHMMMDDLWTVGSVTEEYKIMCDLLARRFIFKRLEFNAKRKRYNHENSLLRRQCREGRAKLKMSLYGQNTLNIRNILIKHKDMQRLYQHMPIHLVVDNINQRTFVMRKERDRLEFRLEQLQETYKKKLLEQAAIQNRIKYQNEFALEDDVKSREFTKKLEGSSVRLRAIKTINATYQKMIQVLRHDALFYEPILTSLAKDIEDQTNFVKHVLHMGMPAIAKFKELSKEYRQIEDRSYKNNLAKVHFVANLKNKIVKSQRISQRPKFHDPKMSSQRYVRETKSMSALKYQLEDVEDIIKTVKFATLSSQVKQIFPRMKAQIENNIKLKHMIDNDILGHQTLGTKMKFAKVLQGVLVHNSSEEELLRLERIQNLQKKLDNEYKIQEDTIKYMKNRADIYVLLRFTLWNLCEILRHVDRKPRPPAMKYPNSYLKLPLLKFEMFTMRSYPPEIYEENFDTLMHAVKRKVNALMSIFPIGLNAEKIADYTEDYHTTFLNEVDKEDLSSSQVIAEDDDDVITDVKTLQNVPTRRQIKENSVKIVEEFSKKED